MQGVKALGVSSHKEMRELQGSNCRLVLPEESLNLRLLAEDAAYDFQPVARGVWVAGQRP